MCEMLNLFIPKRNPAFGPPVRGLRFAPVGEIQRDFAARFGREEGVFVAGSGGGACLCGFSDWDALYAIARDLLTRNSITWVAAIHFWSGDRYKSSERTVDPDDAEVCTPVEVGEIVILRGEPAEQRRHRQVLRELSRRVGQEVTLRLKNGREIHGALAAFDAASETGTAGGQFFVAAQVFAVEAAGG